MNFYQRKLYALLQAPELQEWGQHLVSQLECLKNDLPKLQTWWGESDNIGRQAQDIGSSSDRVNLFHLERIKNTEQVTVSHPISGQKQQVAALKLQERPDISRIKDEPNAKKVFWWFWRFYPELLAATQPDALLFPAHTVIPDCPLHSHQSTVSALTGAMFPKTWEVVKQHKTPYLLIFSFSPVQEFIKSSRKFLDFWAGSYLLHYLSAQLCWQIAQQLGPDAVIVPSLWSQEIIDALIVKKYGDFAPDFTCLQNGREPVNRFTDKTSTSLSTAGFPNMMTIVVPGKEAAQKWGRYLAKKLTKEWRKIGINVRNDIRQKVIAFLDHQTKEELKQILNDVFPELNNTPAALDPYLRELQLLKQQCCWEWNNLWEAQLNYTWEPYWTAIPLGNPEKSLTIDKGTDGSFDQTWVKEQTEIAQPVVDLPNQLEKQFYTNLNVGTWWGSIQQRLRHCLNEVKYTRNWQIATAPGERSTISGQLSAVHPRLNYQVRKSPQGEIRDLREGGGVAAVSLRLFWFVMSLTYPGLFNGSEKLNALELTKRMAWVYGGVAKSLGIPIELTEDLLPDYEQYIRFPNLSSIAAASFAREHPNLVKAYRKNLYQLFQQHKNKFSSDKKDAFYAKTTRPFQILNTDQALKGGYNGVMFSSKWLIDDMGLQEQERAAANTNADSSYNQNNRKQVDILREIVQQAHQQTGFGDSSPADWWVIILADGDGMGNYVSGKELKKYGSYIEVDAVNKSIPAFDEKLFNQFLKETKRMGPATHVGLNRALLDFSNRLVPYITEKRFCGRVIYSGGDDVMVVLPLEDLPEYLLSLRAAWSGGKDPKQEFENERNGVACESNNQTQEAQTTGYWYPNQQLEGLPQRPHFTMGREATMSAGVVIAHKSVPLPTVLESLWTAEADRAKKMTGKDGICFRVIYGSGNQLEALMKGKLLETWWDWVKEYESYKENLSPLLYRLAEELPRRAFITENHQLFSKAAKVIMDSRDPSKQLDQVFEKIETWLDKWEDWAKKALEKKPEAIGTDPEDLANLLRFTAFWVDKRVERQQWGE